jgi:hypothetical protein
VDATPNSANEKQINTQTTLVRLDYFVFLILVFGSFVLFANWVICVFMVEYVWCISMKEHRIFIFSVVQLNFVMFDDMI